MKFETNHLDIQLKNRKKNIFDKPPASYITLIQEAIKKSPKEELTLSEIYESLKKDYDCFRTNQYDGWKNSIRHNLSLNKCFIKIPKTKDRAGRGHYWKINPDAKDQFNDMTVRRRPRGYQNIESKRSSNFNSASFSITPLNSFESSMHSTHSHKSTKLMNALKVESLSNCQQYFHSNQQVNFMNDFGTVTQSEGDVLNFESPVQPTNHFNCPGFDIHLNQTNHYISSGQVTQSNEEQLIKLSIASDQLNQLVGYRIVEQPTPYSTMDVKQTELVQSPISDLSNMSMPQQKMTDLSTDYHSPLEQSNQVSSTLDTQAYYTADQSNSTRLDFELMPHKQINNSDSASTFQTLISPKSANFNQSANFSTIISASNMYPQSTVDSKFDYLTYCEKPIRTEFFAIELSASEQAYHSNERQQNQQCNQFVF